MASSSKLNHGDDESGSIQFVLCQTLDRNAVAMKDAVCSVMDMAAAHDAVVISVLASIVMITFGFPRSAYAGQRDEELGQRRRHLADALVRALEHNIRVVHGSLYGTFGTIGTDRRFLYGPTIPGVNPAMEQLLRMPYGTSIELPQADSAI